MPSEAILTGNGPSAMQDWKKILRTTWLQILDTIKWQFSTIFGRSDKPRINLSPETHFLHGLECLDI